MFEEYKDRMERRGRYISDVLRNNSDAVTNATFNSAVCHRKVIVKHINEGLPIFNEWSDELLDAHFEQKSKFNITGDEVTYWLTFRPHEHKFHSEIAVGSYVSIPNEDGDRDIWLIVHCDIGEEQRKYQVLQTNHILKWVCKGKIHEHLVCLRNANSYNSGVFDADRTTAVEDLNTIFAPTNDDICTIAYDQRFIISDGNREAPICWMATKFQTLAPKGLTKIGLAQVSFDAEHDNKELGIADYYRHEIEPVPYDEPKTSNITISYSGTKPTIKVGGSVKTFTATFDTSSVTVASWSVSDGIHTYTTSTNDYDITVEDSKLKLKVKQNYKLIGTVLTVKVIGSDNSFGTTKVEVV